jgi:ATPase family associated with various cellular activities (AAA)/Winged helix domain, variant
VTSLVAAPGKAHALSLFHLELERVRVRAMLAIERLADGPPASTQERLVAELARVDATLAERRPGGRAQALARRTGLDDDDLELLWTAVAVAVDPRVMPHAIVLGGGEARRGLSLSVHALIAQHDGPRARQLAQRLVGRHPLIRDHVLDWAGGDAAPAARSLHVPARTITWLAGGDEPDEEMAGAGAVVALPADPQLDDRQAEVMTIVRGVLGGEPSPLVVMEGATGTGRRTAIARVAAALGRTVIALELRRLPHGLPALEAALIALRRECRLQDAIPLVADIDELTGDDGDDGVALRRLATVIDDVPGAFAITSSRAGLELPVVRPLVRVRWSTPETATRRALWLRELGDDAARLDPHLDGLAVRYRMGAGGIARAVASARLIAGASPLDAGHLIDGVRTNIAERLGELAVRQDTPQTWDDLVLAPDILDQVKGITARVRHAHRVLEDWGFASKLPRGAGVAVLFSGPPGTGKTMVAGLIARELELELYQVDLSKIVSKWVGETEKQLARLFEAAEAGHALLLFDEADALFAKRTEVKSSVDRYANLEVNYLLQRIESFGGVSILTTNLEASIDPALRRRLAANVVFWPPDQDERVRLWRRMLEARAPVATDVDAPSLAAEFGEMTGANIRNAVLAAAFLAAAEDAPITQARLERAARGEYSSMGRVLGKR